MQRVGDFASWVLRQISDAIHVEEVHAAKCFDEFRDGVSLIEFVLKKPVDKKCKKACEKMRSDPLVLLQVYRSCFEFGFHDPEGFFDLPSSVIDLENIRNIILSLEEDSDAASDAVSRSIEKAQAQEEIITSVESGFDSIESDMLTLANHIKGIDASIDDLQNSNQGIVDSISQLFAVAEEVTASTDAVMDTVRKNKENVDQAAAAMNEVYNTAMSIS